MNVTQTNLPTISLEDCTRVLGGYEFCLDVLDTLSSVPDRVESYIRSIRLPDVLLGGHLSGSIAALSFFNETDVVVRNLFIINLLGSCAALYVIKRMPRFGSMTLGELIDRTNGVNDNHFFS